MTNQPPQRRGGSPGFYRGMAVLFFAFAGLFIWQAVKQHSWFFWFFGAITVVNGLVSILRSVAAKEAAK